MSSNATSSAPALEAPTPAITRDLKKLAAYIGIPLGTMVGAYMLYRYMTKEDSEATTASTDQKEVVEDSISAESVIETSSAPSAETPEKSPFEQARDSKERGNKFFKSQRYERAIELYTEAIEMCPRDKASDLSTFYQNRSAAHEQLKNWQGVVEDTTTAIELNPRYSKALLRRAKAYEALDEKILCLEDVTAVCLIEGLQNQQSMLLADRILKAIGKEKAEKHFVTRKKVLPSNVFIRSYLDSFNKNVFALPEEAIMEDEKLTNPYVQATLKSSLNKFEDVEGLCTQEIAVDGPHTNLATLLRGTIYCLMCDIDSAMKDFDAIVNLEDTDDNKKLKVDALIKRGSLKMQQADDTGCYGDLKAAELINPQDASLYHHRGQLYFLTERLEEAKLEFQKSMSLDNQFVAPRCHLGFCLSKMAMQSMSPSKMHEANQILEETTKQFPKSPEAWSLYGQLLQDQQEFEKASEKLQKSIELAPDNPTTYVYLALLILQTKQDAEGVEAAIKQIRKAVDMDDKCDFAFETLATLEVQRGNAEEAQRLFHRVIELVRTEAEMANTFSMLEASKAQTKVSEQYGVRLPQMGGM